MANKKCDTKLRGLLVFFETVNFLKTSFTVWKFRWKDSYKSLNILDVTVYPVFKNRKGIGFYLDIPEHKKQQKVRFAFYAHYKVVKRSDH